MRKILVGIISSLLVLYAVSAALASQEAEVKAMVDKAADSFKEKGVDYTVRLLNAGSGPFRKGELYVFAMSFNGLMLGHSANRDLVGKNQIDLQDAKGHLIFPPMLDIAKNQGSGWTEYWWARHGEKDPALKRTYIKRVPGKDIFLGAGYYVK
jgi:cytochrome c